MKRVYFLFAALSFTYFVNAQTVENIRVEPDGDNIKISYRIGGSTDAQLYNVELTCSMDGGPRFEPRTVIGDVGENIRGGRSFYTVVWDVFEDVDEVGDAEFFIKVDLVSDLSPTRAQTQPQVQPQTQLQTQPQKAREQNPGLPDQGAVGTQKQQISWRSYLAYTGSTDSPIGISFGTLKNFGTYGSIRYGSHKTDYYTDFWITLAAGLTKYIFESGFYRLHGYGGIGANVSVFDVYSTDSFTDSFFVIDAGIINVIGKLNLNLGLEVIRDIGTYPVFGIGIAF